MLRSDEGKKIMQFFLQNCDTDKREKKNESMHPACGVELMKAQKVLIVEDDKRTAELIRLYLVKEGYRVFVAYDGTSGLQQARDQKPDLIVLDVMLPGMNGIEVCRVLREESDVAIIMLTARTAEYDRLSGLNTGADDYVMKPFSPRELAARVRAVLRRLPDAYHRRGPEESVLGDIRINYVRREVTAADQPVRLTPTEFKILGALMREPGRVFSRDQLAEAAWGIDFEGTDRTIDVHILNIRKKLSRHIPADQYIRTVFGTGYTCNYGGET